MINDTQPIKVSIITPVYNGENYIEQCFACVKSQTYHNIEWVVINDGSRDASLAKLQQLAVGFPNLTIIDQKNAGAAEARRAGALTAQGDYIVYLDIDDAISENAIESAMTKFTEHIDLVLFTQIRVGGNQPVNFTMFTDNWPQTGENVFKSCIDGWGAHSFGVYRKAIFNAAYACLDKFDSLSKTYKDELLSRIIFSQSRMIEYCEGIYFYDLNEDSVSKKFNPEYFKIANNVHALNQYLQTENKHISIERMYSRLFFDLLGRYIKWRKELTNKAELESAPL
jgi:glycosyltransferase involved in cell wall biosynthesis